MTIKHLKIKTVIFWVILIAGLAGGLAIIQARPSISLDSPVSLPIDI